MTESPDIRPWTPSPEPALGDRIRSDHIDRAAIGAEWTARLADGMQRSMVVRDHLPPGTAPVFDMHFAEFIRDEVGMVRRIYEHFGMELTLDAEQRMRGFLAQNPKDKHGAHRYVLEDAGLNGETERERYRAYQERFGVESEALR